MFGFNLTKGFLLLWFSVFQGLASNDTADCSNQIQITPSRVVVRYGDPVSVQCVMTQDPSVADLFDWESSEGTVLQSGSRNRTWQLNKAERWDMKPQCFNTFVIGGKDFQCVVWLNMTVYQPPDSIQLLSEMEGDMVEGTEYKLTCSVENVAPIHKLIIRFYRDNILLDQQLHPDVPQLGPQSANFSLTVTAKKEHDGSEVWCETSLDLETTPVNTSARVRTSVLYRPRIQASPSDSKTTVSITEGDILKLNCTAQANPAPFYSWTLPQSLGHTHNTCILILPNVKYSGNYTCTVWNSQGSDVITYLVEVKVDWLPIIAGLVGAAILVLIIIGCCTFKTYHSKTRTGNYELRNLFRSLKGPSNHVALSNEPPL